jgi:predicted amidophosphoribosyltransferase
MWFERQCAVCGARGPVLCAACIDELHQPTSRPPPPCLDGCWSLVDYDGRGRDLVVALKYRNRRDVAGALGTAMAALVDGGGVDAVTWAPTSAARRAARGYDQSRLLARAVARALDRPCRRLLRRARGVPQTGLGLAERRRGPRFTGSARVVGAVLVVDDVLTTGATLSASARALRGAGAREVHGLTAAQTPLKLGR